MSDVNAEFGDFYSSYQGRLVFEYNQKSRELLLHELAVNYGSLSQKDVLLVDNLNVALSGAEAISFMLNEPISFEGVLPFVFLNCSFPHANPPFSVNVNRPVVDLSLGMSKGRLVGRFGASTRFLMRLLILLCYGRWLWWRILYIFLLCVCLFLLWRLNMFFYGWIFMRMGS